MNREKFLRNIVNNLELPDYKKVILEFRWIEEILRLEKSVSRSRKTTQILNNIIVVGGVIVTAMIGYSNPNTQVRGEILVGWSAIVINVTVNICNAVLAANTMDERYKYEERSVFLLIKEGILYSSLSDNYDHCQNHAEGYQRFIRNIEQILETNLEKTLTTEDAISGLVQQSVASTAIAGQQAKSNLETIRASGLSS